MNLKILKPFNSASRGTVLLEQKYKKEYRLKSQTKGLIKTSGRNNKGRITVFHRGGGHKKLSRQLAPLKNLNPLIIENIEYDPNRTALLARVFELQTKKHLYIIAPAQIQVGQTYNNKEEVKLGSRLMLKEIPVGAKIHGVGTNNRPQKPLLQRSAGTFGQLIQKSEKSCLVKLSSGKIKELTEKCFAVLGSVSNQNHRYQIFGKAGRKRWLGIRPTTRGVAMNPVDHPHGGGEGKSSGGRPSVTPWAKPARGKKTKKTK